MSFAPIAIVGRSCVLPGALDPSALWDLVASGRDLVGPAPEGRWGLDPDQILCDPGGTGPGRLLVRPGRLRRGVRDGLGSVGVRGRREGARGSRPIGSLGPPHGPGGAERLRGREGGLASATATGAVARPRTGAIFGNLGFPSEGMAAFARSVWIGNGTRTRRSRRRPAEPVHERRDRGSPAPRAGARSGGLLRRRRLRELALRHQARLRPPPRRRGRRDARGSRAARRRPLPARRVHRSRRPEPERPLAPLSQGSRRPRPRGGSRLRRPEASRGRPAGRRHDPRRHPGSGPLERRARQGAPRPFRGRAGAGHSRRVRAGGVRPRAGLPDRGARHRDADRRRRGDPQHGRGLRGARRRAARVAQVEPGAPDHGRRRGRAPQGARGDEGRNAAAHASRRGTERRARRLALPADRTARALARAKGRRSPRSRRSASAGTTPT